MFPEQGMFDQIMVGGAASSVNLMLHAVLMAAVAWTVQHIKVHESLVPQFAQRTVIIVATGFLLVTGHFVEVLIWAATYDIVGAAPDGTLLVYFAFQNYTTLGYGDILPVDEWRLLGPITALNGIMLIGWSTALIFDVLRRTGPNMQE